LSCHISAKLAIIQSDCCAERSQPLCYWKAIRPFDRTVGDSPEAAAQFYNVHKINGRTTSSVARETSEMQEVNVPSFKKEAGMGMWFPALTWSDAGF